jgi:hypothetical protein
VPTASFLALSTLRASCHPLQITRANPGPILDPYLQRAKIKEIWLALRRSKSINLRQLLRQLSSTKQRRAGIKLEYKDTGSGDIPEITKMSSEKGGR